jgi:O-antigen ligase
MYKLARYCLWAYVFTIPWDMVTLAGAGTVSRITGLVASGVAVLAALGSGRLSRPGPVFWIASMFTVWAAATLLWTVSYESSLPRVITYIQLLASVWMLQEFVRTQDDHHSVHVALCLGAFVPMVDLVRNFSQKAASNSRYTAGNLNGGDLGLTLAVILPIAWQLARRQGYARLVGALYFAMAPVAILLTGTRAAFLSALAGLSIVPISLSLRKIRSQLTLAAALVVLIAGTWFFVPDVLWRRMSTIVDEILSGTMTGRTAIWKAAWRLFPEHPVLGIGVAAFPTVVGRELGAGVVAHNLLVGVLVEQGIVGLAIFLAMLAACALVIRHMPKPDRQLWTVVGVSWLLAVMSLSWEYRKVTWLFVGLIAAQQTHSRLLASKPSRLPRSRAYQGGRSPVQDLGYATAQASHLRGRAR